MGSAGVGIEGGAGRDDATNDERASGGRGRLGGGRRGRGDRPADPRRGRHAGRRGRPGRRGRWHRLRRVAGVDSSAPATGSSASGAATPRSTARASAEVPVPSVIRAADPVVEAPVLGQRLADAHAAAGAEPGRRPADGGARAVAGRQHPRPARAGLPADRAGGAPRQHRLLQQRHPRGRPGPGDPRGLGRAEPGRAAVVLPAVAGRNGLSGTTAPAASGARAYAFVGPVGSVTLTLEQPRDGRVTYSLVATLRTGLKVYPSLRDRPAGRTRGGKPPRVAPGRGHPRHRQPADRHLLGDGARSCRST